MYQKKRLTVVERRETEALLWDLAARKEMLAKTVANLATVAGMERAIRDKFLVVKDGEYVVTLVDRPIISTTTPATKHWWQKIFQ